MTEIPSEFPLPEGAFERQRSLLGGHVETGRHSSRLTRRRLIALAAVILVGGLLVTPELGIGSRLLDLIRSATPREVQTPAWSPDGRRIAFLSRRDGDFDVYVMNADGSGQRRLTRGARLGTTACGPLCGTPTSAWSPDGRKVVFQSRHDGNLGLDVVNADGSGQRMLARNGDAPAWSPDGRQIAFLYSSKIYVMNANGSEHRNLTRPPKPGRSAFLAWSPDGRKLAFLHAGCGDVCFLVSVMNANGSGERKLGLPLIGYASPPVWSPDGRKIAFVGGSNGNSHVYTMNADGSGQRRLTRKSADRYAFPAWSPDGRKIAFVNKSGANPEVYVMNADGSGQQRLTRNPGFDADPTWSPDGRKLAFVSNRDGSYEVYVMNADGSGQRKLTHHGS